jgi:hypothetical protein
LPIAQVSRRHRDWLFGTAASRRAQGAARGFAFWACSPGNTIGGANVSFTGLYRRR